MSMLEDARVCQVCGNQLAKQQKYCSNLCRSKGRVFVGNVDPSFRVCGICKTKKSIEEFSPDRNKRKYYCKACNGIRSLEAAKKPMLNGSMLKVPLVVNQLYGSYPKKTIYL